MARPMSINPREGTQTNMNLNEAVSGLLQLGADGTGVTINVTIQNVEHLTLALPELTEAVKPATSRTTSEPKKKVARTDDRWDTVPNRNAKKRASRFVGAVLLLDDVANFRDINEDLLYDIYDEHRPLADASVSCYDALKVPRLGLSRAAMWDAAFVDLVLAGVEMGDAVAFYKEWAEKPWTLEDVGVSSSADVRGAVHAFSHNFRRLRQLVNGFGF